MQRRQRSMLLAGLGSYLLLTGAAQAVLVTEYNFGIAPGAFTRNASVDGSIITSATAITATRASGVVNNGAAATDGFNTNASNATISGLNHWGMELDANGNNVGRLDFTVTAGANGATVDELRFFGANNGGNRAVFSLFRTDDLVNPLFTGTTFGGVSQARAPFVDLTIAPNTQQSFRILYTEPNNSASRFDDIQLFGYDPTVGKPLPAAGTQLLADYQMNKITNGTGIVAPSGGAIFGSELIAVHSTTGVAASITSQPATGFTAPGGSGSNVGRVSFGDGVQVGFFEFSLINTENLSLELETLQFLLANAQGNTVPFSVFTSEDNFAVSLLSGNSNGAAFVNVNLDVLGELAPDEKITFRIQGTEPNNNELRFDDFRVFGSFVFAAASAVPEPTSLALLALGGAAMMRRRRPC